MEAKGQLDDDLHALAHGDPRDEQQASRAGGGRLRRRVEALEIDRVWDDAQAPRIQPVVLLEELGEARGRRDDARRSAQISALHHGAGGERRADRVMAQHGLRAQRERLLAPLPAQLARGVHLGVHDDRR